jgi:putative transposase
MTERRKSFTAEFKARVALEAIRGHKTVSEIASEHGVHPHQITEWQKLALEGLPDILGDRRKKRKEDQEELVSRLYQQIGQLKVELDWLKKKSGFTS